MRIGLNALFFVPGGLAGVGVYATNLVRHLAQVAPHHQYVLLVSRESRASFNDLPGCTRVVALPTPARVRALRILTEQCLLPFYAKAERLDLLHSLAFTGPLLAPCSLIVSIHDLGFRHWAERFSRFSAILQNALVPAVASRSHHIIAMSHYARDEIALELQIERSKISVVHESCNHSRFHASQLDKQALKKDLVARYGLGTPYILSIASSHRHKNLEGLIRAYALLVREHGFKHQLLLVGHKRRAHADILELIDDLDLCDRVLLTGFVPDADIPPLYSLADLFVFPSFYEGFGIPPLEAMACGTPVVSSNAASLPEVVGDAAWLVDPYDIPALAEGIFHVLEDADLRRELVRRGFGRANRFSWEKTAQETLAVYETVTARSSKNDHQSQV